jgi:hypothetical protein
VLGILSDLKTIINAAHEEHLEEEQRIRAGPPLPPATFKAEKEKQNLEPYDILKQMEGIKIVHGRVRLTEPPPRTKLEFNYPLVPTSPPLSVPAAGPPIPARPAPISVPGISPPVLPPKVDMRVEESPSPPTPAVISQPVAASAARQFAIACASSMALLI